jgi:hypothetical protein
VSFDSSIHVRLSRPAFWVLGALLLAPWGLFALWLVRDRREPSIAVPAPKAPPPPVAGSVASDVTRCAPGPWGRLEYYSTHVEPPDEFIQSDYPVRTTRPWIFPGYTEARLAALWQAAGLDAATIAKLGDPRQRETRPNAIVLRPARDLVIGLAPAARATIYAALAAFPENPAHDNPSRIRAEAAPAWLADSGLPPEAIALTQRLLYPRGVALCLSDEDLVVPTLATSEQRAKYIKTLSRKTGLVLQLVVEHGADVEPLVQYWGRGRRSKDLRPLLQSVARRPQGGTLDAVHLLPSFARTLVFTYPTPPRRAADEHRDCHWTSFNFFNETADDRFLELDHVRERLLADYYAVSGPPAFGDIIMLLRAGTGEAVHSCVYLADNLVFTKNGPAVSVPWLVAQLDTVLAFYSPANGPALETRRYRLKER